MRPPEARGRLAGVLLFLAPWLFLRVKIHMADYLAERDWKAELKRQKIDKDAGLLDALATFAKCRGKDLEDQFDALEEVMSKAAAAQKALKEQKDLAKYASQIAAQAKDELKRVDAALEAEGESDAADKELREGLKRAKTARMFFVMLARGSAAGHLILSKAKVQATDVGEAKKGLGGGRVFRGICFGENNRLVFELKKEPPATLEKLFKQTAKTQAGLSVKPLCRVSLLEEDLGEEPDDDRDTPPPAPGSKAGGPKYAEEQVKKRLAALAGNLKRVLDEKLGDAANVQRASEQINGLVDGGDYSSALRQLSMLEGLVAEAIAGGKKQKTAKEEKVVEEKTKDAPTEAGGPAAEYARLVEALTPELKELIAEKSPRAKDLKLMMSEALTLGRTSKFDGAVAKLREAEALIEELANQAPDAEMYAARRKVVQQLYDKVHADIAAFDADKGASLTAMLEAAEKANEEEQFGVAVGKLDELEGALRSAARAAEARAEIKQAAGSQNVQYKALRVRWANSKTAAKKSLERFVEKMLSHPEVTSDPRYDQIADELAKLTTKLPTFDGTLEKLLDKGDAAKTPTEKQAASAEAAARIAEYERELKMAKVFEQLDSTMFGKFSIHSEMAKTLQLMKAALTARG